MFPPFAADGGGKLWERKSPAFPAKGWHLPRRHLIYRGICYGSALRLQVQKLQLLPNFMVKVLIENCSFAGCRFEGGYWQNVFAEESKFTGCDFNETVFKDTVFRRCFAAICQSEQGVLRQVILDETRLTDSN